MMRERFEDEPIEIERFELKPDTRPWAPYGLIAYPSPFLGVLCLIVAIIAIALASARLPGEKGGGLWTYGCYAVAALLLFVGTRCWLGRVR